MDNASFYKTEVLQNLAVASISLRFTDSRCDFRKKLAIFE